MNVSSFSLSAADIELALDAAHAAKDGWGTTSAAHRSNVLHALACAAPFREEALLAEIRGAGPYQWVDAETFGRLLARPLDVDVRAGGYWLTSLKSKPHWR